MSDVSTPLRADLAFRALRDRTREISSICVALANATDAARVWRRIVQSSQVLLNVDGCTLYRVMGNELVPVMVLSRSLGLVLGAEDGQQNTLPPLRMPLPESAAEHDSLAVRVALGGQAINVPDVTRMKNYNASRTRQFDEQMGYQTRSILTVPVRYRSQPCCGVLQFVNVKDLSGQPAEFGTEQEEIALALSSLLAVSLSA